MRFELIPSLQTQRELYQQSRTPDRFRWYLRQMLAEENQQDVVLPMTAVNPLGREHCLEAIEALIAINAEQVMRAALIDAEKRLRFVDGEAKVCLNLVDDRLGGWTNRYFTEATLRFSSEAAERATKHRRLLIVPAWSSEPPAPESLYSETLMACYRRAWWDVRGRSSTLGELLQQEGAAQVFGAAQPLSIPLDERELQAVRAVLQKHHEAIDYPTQFACFFGDDAAVECGYQPLGIPVRGGFAAALEAARGTNPLAFLREQAS